MLAAVECGGYAHFYVLSESRSCHFLKAYRPFCQVALTQTHRPVEMWAWLVALTGLGLTGYRACFGTTGRRPRCKVSGLYKPP